MVVPQRPMEPGVCHEVVRGDPSSTLRAPLVRASARPALLPPLLAVLVCLKGHHRIRSHCAAATIALYNELEISALRSQQQQTDPNFQDTPTQSWYPPSVVGSSSRPSTPTSSSASPHQRAPDHPQPSARGQPSPAEAAGVIARLKDKSIEELQRLLKDKEAYNAFFNSLDQVKTQNNVRDELRKETLQLARENLEKEQRILELRNQCTIIRTTELAAAQDRLADLERQKDDIMRSYSPAALLNKLQSSMAKMDEESEELHQKFLEKDIDLPTFVQKYKKLRTAYHKQALLHLAGQTSLR
ncbi:hypothetical protein C2845_PM01G05510 [Panicum miliaceum]|uniref:VPS37 C-terminal domain-containing protein n=1 Tax=Panicum miliaceum TaxID=4540 RepID=A0A3L6TQB6_PANMI|nr:hypothetical protein C2845_PM01G05510 [Panicum miliaceum]